MEHFGVVNPAVYRNPDSVYGFSDYGYSGYFQEESGPEMRTYWQVK